MLKKHEVALPHSCLNRATDEEPVFVLLGRDASAPAAIRAWALERIKSGKNEETDDQIVEALAMATHMEEFRAKLGAPKPWPFPDAKK